MCHKFVEVPFDKNTSELVLAEAYALKWHRENKSPVTVLASQVVTPDDGLRRFTATGGVDGQLGIFWRDAATNEVRKGSVEGLVLQFLPEVASRLKLS